MSREVKPDPVPPPKEEKKESLKSCALVSQLPDPIKNKIHHFLANSVVSSCVVISSVFLPIDKLLRMEQLTISPTPGFINDSWLKINEDSSWNMLPSTCFAEESGEGIIPKCLVRWHVAIRLDPMLQTVELPTRVSYLAASLAYVHGNTLTHF